MQRTQALGRQGARGPSRAAAAVAGPRPSPILLSLPSAASAPAHAAARRPRRPSQQAQRPSAAAGAAAGASGGAAAAEAAAAPPPAGPAPTASVWELDFCSRPLLDERGKKVWELLVCDPDRTFEHAEYFPNSRINSAELRAALEALLARPGAVRPDKVRFFRGQMQTIVSKAVTELGIKPLPSRRCFTLIGWLQERLEGVYRPDPRYSEKAQTLFNLDLGTPEALPDALRGEKWAFVQLPLGALVEMMGDVNSGETFGSSFTLAQAGAGDVPLDQLIPGVAVFSRRALPLAAWTNGLEIAAVKVDVERSCLILETGVNQRWRYGGWKPSPESIAEAENWERAKGGVKGIHFLAVQPDADADELTGIWLLQEAAPPSI